MGRMSIQFISLLLLCFVMGSMYRQPFGPKYTYSPIDLYCKVANLKVFFQRKEYMFNITQKGISKCPGNTELVYTRHKGLQCVSSIERHMTMTPGDKTRLVVVPIAKLSKYFKPNERVKDYQSYQFNIVNHSLTPYPFMDGTEILDLVYVPKLKKILLSRDEPLMRIESYHLDNRKNEVVSRNIRARFIAVDDDRELLFFLTKRKRIIRMTSKGKSRKSLKTFKPGTTITTLVVDSSHKLLYIPINFRLTSLGYAGNMKNVKIARGRLMYALTLNVKRNIIYYNVNKDMYKVSTDGKRKSKVASFKNFPFNAIYYDQTLYVSLQDVGELFVVDMKEKPEVSSVKLDYKLVSGRELIMCAIP